MTITLSSAVRFALIAPGNPYPRVLLASSTEQSDLLGYYSLRELGLSEVYTPKSSSSLLDALVSPGNSSREASGFSSFDIWDGRGDPIDTREKLHSLIVEGDLLDFSKMKDLSFEAGLERLLRDAIEAHNDDDKEKLEYSGQVISSILELISARQTGKRRRRAFLAKVLVWTVMVYVVIAFGAIGVNFVR